MATRPDFAQKLLNDLRLRKERMGGAQSSSRHSSHTSRAARGNPVQPSRGGRQTGSTTANTSRRNTGSNALVNIKESLSQIVLYEGGQSSRQVRDLSMAIAFAFENSGNLGGSSSNPLVNFFNRFGRRSPSSRKKETSSLYSHNSAGGQFPRGSNMHINEISKGVHKINQILSACSNGLNLDRNSIEIGRELLKGAVDLEESLRMLVSLQDATEYANGSRKTSRIKLLEEDEDEDENDKEKRVEQWKPGRPRFSFDKTSGSTRIIQQRQQQQLALPYKHETLEQPISDSKLVPHRRSNSYVQEFSLATHNDSSSSKSTKEKARISNVIAKLMGLEELPLKEGKQGKVSRESSKQNVPLSRESRNGSDLSTNKKFNSTGTTKMVSSERNQPRKDLNLKQVSTVMRKEQIHTNHVNGLKSFDDSTRKQTHGEDKQGKAVEREGKTLAVNAELQKRAPNKLKDEDKTSNRIEREVSAHSVEKRKGNNYLAKNQHELIQEQVPGIADHSDDRKARQLHKQNLVAKSREGQQVEHINAPKSKRSTAMALQKKTPRDKAIPGDRRFIKPNEKILSKDPTNRIHQDSSLAIDNSLKTEDHQEILKIELVQSQKASKNESEQQKDMDTGSSNQLLSEEKPIEVSATQKRTVIGKVQRREIPEKIVLMTRRNATGNHLARSAKGPANMLKDLKQQMQNKNRRSKKMEEASDSSMAEEGIEVINVSEIIAEPMKLRVTLETKDELQDQNKNRQDKLNLDNNNESTASYSINVFDDLETEEQPPAFKDEEELKQGVQSRETTHDKSIEKIDLPRHSYMQIPALNRQEQLTEPEKDLKEMVIKSHMLLSSAEALFKLNIPVSFLHAGDHENQVSGRRKLLLDSAYEVMKRKARRHEFEYNPYMKKAISNIKLRSLDDLVRQLCKDLEALKSYGMNGSDECDVAAGLHKMLNNDIYNEVPDVNCMWDFEWSRMTSLFPEMEDVVKYVERQMLNGLLDEITVDLLTINV